MATSTQAFNELVAPMLDKLPPIMRGMADMMIAQMSPAERDYLCAAVVDAKTAIDAGDEAALKAVTDRFPGAMEHIAPYLPALMAAGR